MDVSRDVGKVLMNLQDSYYEKGMKKISISLNGIRNGKILDVNRKVVISKLVRSKDAYKFIEQFLENIQEDLETIGNDENVKMLLSNPIENIKLIDNCNQKLLYLYLFWLKKEEYDEILKLLLDNICNEKKLSVEKKNIEPQKEEISSYIKSCEEYEDQIKKLKTISKQRKEKISELEIKNNILYEQNNKLKNENNVLTQKKSKLLNQIKEIQENSRAIIVTQTKQKSRVGLIANEKILQLINEEQVIRILVNEYLTLEKAEMERFDKILVCKKNIHIGKLRKIQKLSGNKVIFFESEEETSKYINSMEDENENGRN